jgi:hypothetical protein
VATGWLTVAIRVGSITCSFKFSSAILTTPFLPGCNMHLGMGSMSHTNNKQINTQIDSTHTQDCTQAGKKNPHFLSVTDRH